MGPTEIVELHGNGSILLIGRRPRFGQLNRFDAKTCGSIEDPQTIADGVRCYTAYPGNGLKLRHVWAAATGGSMMPRNDDDMAGNVGRIVNQGTWMVLEIADERHSGSPVLERIKRRKNPVLATLRGRNVATLSMDEKFALTFDKLTSHLGEGFAEALSELVSPVALGAAVATIAVLTFASGGVVAAIILAVGYAVAGWAIFAAIGDLLHAIKLVANATDESDLDRAAALLAKVASEITLGALIAVLTRGAGRAGGRRVGGDGEDAIDLSNSNAKLSNLEVKHDSRSKSGQSSGKLIEFDDTERLAQKSVDKDSTENFQKNKVDTSLSGLTLEQAKRVLKTAQESYKNTTKAGHALAKYSGRKPGVWGKFSGSQKTWNKQAMNQMRDIFRGEGGFKKVVNNDNVVFLDKKLNDGRGIGLQKGYNFKGFID
ncbi:hypothetical protein J4E05_14345 [Thalassospira sp. NFXS8]